MKVSTVFIANAIVGLVFGLASILAPTQTAAAYGMTLTDTGIALMRVVGANLIGFALIAWLVRNTAASETRHAVVMGFCLGFAVSTLIFLINALSGGVGAAAWVNVVLALAFTLAYGYFAFMKPTSA